MDERRVRHYALTIKKNGNKHCPLSEIDKTLKYIGASLKAKDYKPTVDFVFERDTRGTLHAHGAVRCRPFMYSRVRLNNWHIFFEELKTLADQQRWLKYLKKSPQRIELVQQDDAKKYYNSHNGFI